MKGVRTKKEFSFPVDETSAVFSEKLNIHNKSVLVGIYVKSLRRAGRKRKFAKS